MDIRHFVTFKKVAELDHFTRASEVLGYAQSNVTAHIQTLESNLDTRLFDRIGKQLNLLKRAYNFLNM
jgi:DNA-binding transcriptional LysR family regulator